MNYAERVRFSFLWANRIEETEENKLKTFAQLIGEKIENDEVIISSSIFDFEPEIKDVIEEWMSDDWMRVISSGSDWRVTRLVENPLYRG